MQHSWKVLADWARLAGVPMNFPSRWHPAKSVAAMRFCCALEDDQAALVRFARRAFASYFDRQENLDDPAVLEIGRAHVCTPVTNAQLVCRLLLEKKNKYGHCS